MESAWSERCVRNENLPIRRFRTLETLITVDLMQKPRVELTDRPPEAESLQIKRRASGKLALAVAEVPQPRSRCLRDAAVDALTIANAVTTKEKGARRLPFGCGPRRPTSSGVRSRYSAA